MAEAYRESANPNAAASFPYLVREVAHGRSLTFDPCFHSMHWHADVQFIYVADGTIDVATLREYFIGTRTALHVLEELVRFTKTPPPTRAASVLVRLLRLVVLLREHVPLAPAETREDPNALRTKHVLRCIAARYAEGLTLDDLAQSAACSKSACLRAFRACMKTTPYKYLIEYRLEQAALLLRQAQTPITEIAEAVGFRHFSLFGKSFKEKTGMTPKEYRRQALNS